ncbi:MAG: restriction endonuclease subunit S [Lachnospiraceae bacterium]|jgi:type I restriction enzyme S subunit
MNAPKLRFKEFNDGWQKKELREISQIYDGTHQTPNYIQNGVPFVSVEDISDIEKTNKFISKNAFEKEFKIKPQVNDILMTRITAGIIGATAIVKNNNPLGYYVSLALIRKNKEIDVNYLNQYINCFKFKKELNKRIIHVAFPKKINLGDIGKCKISITSINEQQKIGKMLNILDRKIELQSKKIEDLKLFKLYTKNQIFNDYDEVFKLKDILVKWNKKNKNNSVKYVESISNKYGFISQSDQFEDRNVASKNLNNYYIIEKGVFGYNPSRLNVGSLALKTNDKISVVSPLYECFTTSQNNQYLLEWFGSKYFRKETISKFEGGVRNTLNFSNLCEIEIRLPIIEKQNKYSNIFRMFNNKIELEVKKLYKLQELKKGLMQNMFV